MKIDCKQVNYLRKFSEKIFCTWFFKHLYTKNSCNSRLKIHFILQKSLRFNSVLAQNVRSNIWFLPYHHIIRYLFATKSHEIIIDFRNDSPRFARRSLRPNFMPNLPFTNQRKNIRQSFCPRIFGATSPLGGPQLLSLP